MSYDLDDEERAIAESVITELAPDELPLLRQLMTRPRWRDRLHGKSIGYGIDSALPVIAPYVLVVVVWARSVVASEAKNVMEPRLRALTRRLLLVHDPKASPPASPTRLNPDELREAVIAYAVTLGLSTEQASLLANAVVGRVLPRVEQ